MKNIVYICTAFYPENAIGAIRNTKLVKYLVRNGYSVTVIYPDKRDLKMYDETLFSEELDLVRQIKVKQSKFFDRLILKKRNKVVKDQNSHTNKKDLYKQSKIKEGVYTLLQEAYTLVRNFDWVFQVNKVNLSNEIIDQNTVLISGYPSLSSHLIAKKMRSNSTKLRWIADFRDPLAYKSLNTIFMYEVYRIIQRQICLKSDLVTYVTNDMKNKISYKIENKEKFKYLPNGFDNDDLKGIKKSKINSLEETTLNISYVGGLYNGKRDLNQLFRVIRILINNGDISANKIRFYYAGKEFNVLKNQALKFDLEQILVDKGFVAREDSLAIQNQSDIVVVSTWNTEKDVGVIPGKIYECFLLKKPTITITNGTKPNSELGSMVKKSGLGVEVNAMIDDEIEVEQLKKFILQAYDSVINNTEFIVNYNEEYISRFNYENITKQLIQLIEELV